MLAKHKVFKILLITVASIFVLTSIGLIILVNYVDPNKYKPLIIASVNENTGRQLHLDGKINWEIWPNIGLELRQVSLSNPEGFESANFIEIQNASISLNILPLLRNRIVVNDLKVQGLKLNLIDMGKKNNWTFSPDNNATQTHESSSVHFELHSFSLTNADIKYHNLVKKTQKEIKNLNFNLDTPSDGGIKYNSTTGQFNLEGVNFSLNKNLKGTIQLDLHSEPKLLYDGNIKLDQFSLNKVLANLNMKPINIKNKAILDSVSFKSDFDGNNKSANLSNLDLNIGPSSFVGNVKVNNFAPLNIQNDINVNEIEASDWINTSGYKIPMHDTSLRGTLNYADLGISKIVMQQHLTINNIELYGTNIQNKINYAERTLTVAQFADPIKLFERLNTMLTPANYAKIDLKQKTDLGKLDTNIVMRNGILTTPGFVLAGPTLRVTNSGSVNFNKNYIDYYTYTRIVSLPARSLLGSLTYPYIIQGNLDNPETSVDKISLQKQVVDYYTSVGATGVVNSVKQETKHLWNKIFH